MDDEYGKFVLSDFGIAHFDREEFPIDNKTRKGERLANIEFSAPEQINNQYAVTKRQIYTLWLRLCIGLYSNCKSWDRSRIHFTKI